MWGGSGGRMLFGIVVLLGFLRYFGQGVSLGCLESGSGEGGHTGDLSSR